MSSRTNTAKMINGRWTIKVQKNGVRKAFYSSAPGKAGQREANAKADAWLDGNLTDSRSRVSAVWAAYLEDVEARSGYSNYRRIKSIGDAYILPLIGHMRVSAVTEGDLQSVVNKAYKHGNFGKNSRKKQLAAGETLSRKTLQNLVATLKNFIKYCRVTAHATTLNPETLKVPTSARRGQKTILQPEDLKILFSSDQTTWRGKPCQDDMVNAYRLAVLTGLRPGVLIGLRWGDIAVDNDRISVRRAINIHGEETQGKNENAVRSIPLSSYARSVIESQRSMVLDAGGKISAKESVFDVTCEQTLYKQWGRYCEANNIQPCTLYELRHTFVSIASLLPAGEVKSYVGHSRSMDTFGTYGHRVHAYDDQVREDFTELFDKLLG